jgi:hypothetical protein
MKAFAKGVLSVLMAACFAGAALAQGNPRGTSILQLHGKTVSVEYERPSLNGRTTDTLLGNLPPGGIWRLGADTSATFKTEIDLAFGGVAIPAGEYSIWMQRQKDNSWNLLFDKQDAKWGEPAPDASECFASVPLIISGPHDSPPELLTITLDPTMVWDRGGWIVIQWGMLEAKAFFEPVLPKHDKSTHA